MDPSARIGTTLRNKWRLDRLLGVGGFAAVYSSTHRAGKRVAIKVLHSALGQPEEARRRFLKEAYAANAVDHPAVVSVSDDDVAEDGAPFLVMELLEGETAETRRKKAGGRLPVAGVLFLADEVLGALVAAHAKGIVHRDLKPDNLFMTTDGHVKVLDFGIARYHEPGHDTSGTQMGLTMGSPGFMAPEQACGHWSEVDGRTDIYSLGATMFALLSGRTIRSQRGISEAIIEAATKPAPLTSSVAPDIPEAVAAIVDRALEFERERRWPDAAAMRAAVRRVRASLAGTAGTVPLRVAAAAEADEDPSAACPGPGNRAASAPATTIPLRPDAGPASDIKNTRPVELHRTSSSVSAQVVTPRLPARRRVAAVVLPACAAAALGIACVLAWRGVRRSSQESVGSGVQPHPDILSTASGATARFQIPDAPSAAVPTPSASTTAAHAVSVPGSLSGAPKVVVVTPKESAAVPRRVAAPPSAAPALPSSAGSAGGPLLGTRRRK